MIEKLRCVSYRGSHVIKLELWQFGNNLFRRESTREQIENVGNTDPHTTNTRAATALPRINRHSRQEFVHKVSIRLKRSAPIPGGISSGHFA